MKKIKTLITDKNFDDIFVFIINIMSKSISIVQIDKNQSNWVEQFLTRNKQKVFNTLQDKITTLYLLQKSNALEPVTLDDILKISPEFIKAIVVANKSKDQGHKVNQLVATVLLYNLGAISLSDKVYVENSRFREVFLANNGTDARNIRSMLKSIPLPEKPLMVVGGITVTKAKKIEPTRKMVQDGQEMTICNFCDSAIFNDKGICGYCREGFTENRPDFSIVEDQDYDHYDDPDYEVKFYDRQYLGGEPDDNYYDTKYDIYDEDYDYEEPELY